MYLLDVGSLFNVQHEQLFMEALSFYIVLNRFGNLNNFPLRKKEGN